MTDCVLDEAIYATDSTMDSPPAIFMKPSVAKIAAKFQLTVPSEVRNLYDLREGDLLEFRFDEGNKQLVVEPKRASLLSPRSDNAIAMVKQRRAIAKERLNASEAKNTSRKAR